MAHYSSKISMVALSLSFFDTHHQIFIDLVIKLSFKEGGGSLEVNHMCCHNQSL